MRASRHSAPKVRSGLGLGLGLGSGLGLGLGLGYGVSHRGELVAGGARRRLREQTEIRLQRA